MPYANQGGFASTSVSKKLGAQNTTKVYLTFGLKIGPKLEHWFLKLGGVFSRMRTNQS